MPYGINGCIIIQKRRSVESRHIGTQTRILRLGQVLWEIGQASVISHMRTSEELCKTFEKNASYQKPKDRFEYLRLIYYI